MSDLIVDLHRIEVVHVARVLHLFYAFDRRVYWRAGHCALECLLECWRGVALHSWVWSSRKTFTWRTSWYLVQLIKSLIRLAKENIVNLVERSLQKYPFLNNLFRTGLIFYVSQLIVHYVILLRQVLIQWGQFVHLVQCLWVILDNDSARFMGFFAHERNRPLSDWRVGGVNNVLSWLSFDQNALFD